MDEAIWESTKTWMATDDRDPDPDLYPGMVQWISMTGPRDSDAHRAFMQLRGVWLCAPEFLYSFFPGGCKQGSPGFLHKIFKASEEQKAIEH